MYLDVKQIPTPHIYKTIILIPTTATIKLKDRCIYVTGTLGTLTLKLHKSIDVQLHDVKKLLIYTNDANINNKNKALIGTTRALINGMINGVTTGFVKKLQLIGIGYRIAVQNNIINLTIGFSHAISYALPVEIKATCPSQTEIIITGINKQIVGQIAADLRSFRPPEPFKGKGIRYVDEIVHNKDTKKR